MDPPWSLQCRQDKPTAGRGPAYRTSGPHNGWAVFNALSHTLCWGAWANHHRSVSVWRGGQHHPIIIPVCSATVYVDHQQDGQGPGRANRPSPDPGHLKIRLPHVLSTLTGTACGCPVPAPQVHDTSRPWRMCCLARTPLSRPGLPEQVPDLHPLLSRPVL